jgi:hypothetical protein
MDMAYASYAKDHLPAGIAVYSRWRMLACVNGRKDAADLRLFTMERLDDGVKEHVMLLLCRY